MFLTFGDHTTSGGIPQQRNPRHHIQLPLVVHKRHHLPRINQENSNFRFPATDEALLAKP